MKRISLTIDDFNNLINWEVIKKRQSHSIIQIDDIEIILEDIWFDLMLEAITNAINNSITKEQWKK